MNSSGSTERRQPAGQAVSDRTTTSPIELRPALVVTGASGGIGRAIAQLGAAQCGAVVLIARSVDGLRGTADEVRAAGGEPFLLELDLTRGDAAGRVTDFLCARGLFCDILVNSAGYGLRGRAAELTIEEQLGIIDLNIRALAALTLQFLPGMVERDRGGIINLGSLAGFVPGPYMAIYYASKAFVRSFSEALYQEVRRTGVTVTCVAPGPVRTAFYERAGAKRARLFSLLPELTAEEVAAHAWRGFEARKRLVVPGLSTKLAIIAAGILPRPAKLLLVAQLQRSRPDEVRD
jgi:uncharacterized protein